jgi:hypothetical protein
MTVWLWGFLYKAQEEEQMLYIDVGLFLCLITLPQI